MKLVAFERSKQGTGASRRLRISGRTPGIVYGGATEPKLIELDHNALWHALKKEAYHSSILSMDIAGTEHKVLLRDVQVHPYKQLILHVDFQRVDAKTRLHMKVPLHFSGDDQSEAIKSEGCIANHVLSELDVFCLPADLPEFIEVDLSGLQKGSSVHLSDIRIPKGVKVLSHGGEKNPVIVTAVMIAAVEEEAPVAAVEAAEAAPADASAEAKK